jgi:hypothetical protein
VPLLLGPSGLVGSQTPQDGFARSLDVFFRAGMPRQYGALGVTVPFSAFAISRLYEGNR